MKLVPTIHTLKGGAYMPYNDILAKLKDAIRFVSDNIHDYVVKSKSDFTQKGKLTPENSLPF